MKHPEVNCSMHVTCYNKLDVFAVDKFLFFFMMWPAFTVLAHVMYISMRCTNHSIIYLKIKNLYSKLFCTFANHYLCTNLKYLVVVYHNAISEEGGHDHVIATVFQGQEVWMQPAKQCSKISSTFSLLVDVTVSYTPLLQHCHCYC